jgi:hypothetical protein
MGKVKIGNRFERKKLTYVIAVCCAELSRNDQSRFLVNRNREGGSMCDKTKFDIRQGEFPKVSWEPGKIVESLESLRGFIVQEGTQASDWYLQKRRGKRRGGQITRISAMIVVTLAGVLPVLVKMLPESSKLVIDPAWATVLLAIAGLLVSFDYFFGFTSGWVRYLEARQKILRTLNEFQFDWEALRTNWATPEPGPEQVRSALLCLKTTLLKIEQIVEDETSVWATEFRTTVQKLDEAARAKAEAAPATVGATVTVTNGAGIGTWALSVNDGSPEPHSGDHCALVGLRPGPHKFVVEGKLAGNPARDEVTAEIRPTGVTEVSLTLK